MPDRRSHRGQHPEDAAAFAPAARPALRRAAGDLCWLLDRGYAIPSSLKLVGDRFGLTQRQRIAVNRCACSGKQLERRLATRVEPATLANSYVLIDGYNLLTTIEAALAGGIVLAGRDGCYRDMASMHGSYRKVAETLPAIRLIGEVLAEVRPRECRWLLDRPVSNSGRLKTLLRESAVEAGWNWAIDLVADPDALLASAADPIVVTADSGILDRCGAWLNLARLAIDARIPDAVVVDLAPDPPGTRHSAGE
ncbi:MAG: DUF434 domain-containing protein [Planctomycetales bacterium]